MCGVRPRASGTVETPHVPPQRVSVPRTANRPPLAYPFSLLPRSYALSLRVVFFFFFFLLGVGSQESVRCSKFQWLNDVETSLSEMITTAHVHEWIAPRVCPSGREFPAWGQQHDLTAPEKAYAPCCESLFGRYSTMLRGLITTLPGHGE